MKNKIAKITKMLEKTAALTEQALSAKKEKQRDKKLAKAEKIGRMALALSREQIAAGAGDNGYSALISAVYRLSVILMRQGRADEAEPLLAEVCAMEQYIGHRYGIACRGYYGSILCDHGDYNKAGEILSEMVEAAGKDGSQLSAMADTDALCRGYGNAALAFTYAVGVGYSGSLFVQPVERLLRLRESGVPVAGEHLIKAAYFAGSEALYRTTYDPVSYADAADVVKLAKCCLDECERAGYKGFYRPAAMRLSALAAARDCRFADCVRLCKETLDVCASYADDSGDSRFGSVQSIAADMNLLLGVMHYRAWQFEECIGYFEAAIAALEADAKGKPLQESGYVEVERMVMRMTSAEKAAFAHRFLGLSRYSLKEKYTLSDCLAPLRRSASLLEKLAQDEPYFGLLASEDYGFIRQICEKMGDSQQAAEAEQLGKSRSTAALSDFNMAESLFDQRMETMRAHKRTALRLGLLEMVGDYLGQELMLLSQPERHTDRETLAFLYFEMGDYCATVGKHESAEQCFAGVEKNTFDGDDKPYYDIAAMNYWEAAALKRVSALVHMEEMPRAREVFRQYTARQQKQRGHAPTKEELAETASAARKVGLNPAACAEYFHTAAQAFRNDEDAMTAAELFNQEGICWYNASPEKDIPDGQTAETADKASLAQTFDTRELEAFEQAYERLKRCDPTLPKAVDLLPSLLSNIGECHLRAEKYDLALPYYLDATAAFEALFAGREFQTTDKAAQMPIVFQYGACFKTLGEIYDAKDDNRSAADSFTKAIGVFERLEGDAARHELAYCLNARGCLRFRLGDYRGEVEDVTRALALKKDDEGSEMTMAIMLKNRSDAYRELGNYKSMHADLSQSIEMLDHSGMPEQLLKPFYGSHWFSMGVCQEGLNKVGKAADAYRKAAGYMQSSDEESSDGSNVFLHALCHFRRAVCLCKRDEQEFYGALFEYNNAINLLENLPSSREKNENLKQVLSSRANLYEVFREIDLAKEDYRRAESLGTAADERKAEV